MLALVTLNWAYGGIKVRQNAHTVHVLNIHIAEGMETINHLLKHMSVTPKVDELLKKKMLYFRRVYDNKLVLIEFKPVWEISFQNLLKVPWTIVKFSISF